MVNENKVKETSDRLGKIREYLKQFGETDTTKYSLGENITIWITEGYKCPNCSQGILKKDKLLDGKYDLICEECGYGFLTGKRVM